MIRRDFLKSLLGIAGLPLMGMLPKALLPSEPNKEPFTRREREYVSTGIPALDKALGGGYPVGELTLIVGDYSSVKKIRRLLAPDWGHELRDFCCYHGRPGGTILMPPDVFREMAPNGKALEKWQIAHRMRERVNMEDLYRHAAIYGICSHHGLVPVSTPYTSSKWYDYFSGHHLIHLGSSLRPMAFADVGIHVSNSGLLIVKNRYGRTHQEQIPF